jgi:hypothetical protein
MVMEWSKVTASQPKGQTLKDEGKGKVRLSLKKTPWF